MARGFGDSGDKEVKKKSTKKKDDLFEPTVKEKKMNKTISIKKNLNKVLATYAAISGKTQSDIIEKALEDSIPKKYFDLN